MGDSDGDSDGSRPSVSELVRSFASPGVGVSSESANRQDKRGRSVSGESTAPPSKRPPSAVMTPPTGIRSDLRESVDNAVERLETSLMTTFSKEFHEFRNSMHDNLKKLEDRIIELEVHVNERDSRIEELDREFKQAKQDVNILGARAEKAEMNSRLSCLILSGRAMAPESAGRRSPAVTSRTPGAVSGPPGAGLDPRSTSAGARSAERAAGGDLGSRSAPVAPHSANPARGEPESEPDGGAQRGRPAAAGSTEEENVGRQVISVLQARMPWLNLREQDIDRAHRLPGPNHRVIVKFVQSGAGSKRDLLLTRRTELRGYNDLFVNESLTAQNGQIFRALLQAKKDKKIYTVFTRGGVVFCKTEQFSTRTRVDSVAKLAELGFRVA